jgi:hypothetical protein
MGVSTDAMLMYGYDLGGDEEWRLRECGEYGELPPLDWWQESDDEDAPDFIGAAERRLLAEVAGFTETDRRADGYFDRKQEAERQLGVEFESHCSGEYPMWVLSAKTITVYRGYLKVITTDTLAVEPEWDQRLRAALDALGLQPTQEQAAWLLCSYWG